MTNMASDGKAVTRKKVFSRETAVRIDIQANKSIIWALLTNAEDFSRWNSTILSIEGDITKGEKIKLKSVLDPKRTFKLKVKEFEAENRLVWGDAMGKRTYTLKTVGDELTNFMMTEKIGGPMFPLFARMIPPFDQSFEKFAKDLKKEAEFIQNSK
ncbi:SRPBCC domain-containing protein [Ulvibacterium marinum]|uniref:SRPBCC domain-containing protein n=1 Tax=Ulvibacterium marinum TaxID=2419782 RepID=A0A3B0CBC5_9FLAO|nr:SRPBCC domain-containing protein [Ulvibacterium marinum]RKN80246.1 SRPBCC domain-containing protein [Ulvibacterium marinum]